MCEHFFCSHTFCSQGFRTGLFKNNRLKKDFLKNQNASDGTDSVIWKMIFQMKKQNPTKVKSKNLLLVLNQQNTVDYMAFEATFTLDLIQELENFLERKRPPDEIRHKLDLGYRFENQSVFIFEIRPQWNNPGIIREYDFAKCTYVKTKKCWTIFWLPGNLKWNAYQPKPKVKTLKEFLNEVEADKHHCFFG